MENLFINEKGLDLLRTLRFGQSGYNPLFEKPTNFIEQTNQCFTYIVCLEAVEYLLKQYSGKSFYVNFGRKQVTMWNLMMEKLFVSAFLQQRRTVTKNW